MTNKYYTNGNKMLAFYCATSVGSQPWAPQGYYVGIDGVTYRGVAWDGSGANNRILKELNPLLQLVIYPSSDTVEDYNSAQTALTNVVGTYSQAMVFDPTTASANYTITVTSATDITINSLHITKQLRLSNGSAWVEDKEILFLTIYLDTPITIRAGETKSFTITRTMTA